jgi:YhgE/Pip N-terminal domain/YhgE/Pip C-terminal domain
MGKVFDIFLHDLKSIVVNPVAIFITVGLCLLPSLYAWINIFASWNPYGQTGNLPVAVVSMDEGAVFNGENMNVGDEIIAQLKKNKSIGWEFPDQWQGNYGLNEGKYYAMIEIPADFSRDIVTLITASPKKPDIIYRVSEKENAIANKITNVAIDRLASEVQSNFIAVVDKQILSKLNLQEGDIAKNKSNILQLHDTMSEAYSDISKIKGYIDKSDNTAASLQNYLQKVKAELPVIRNQIASLQAVVQADKNLALYTQESIDSTGKDINNDVAQIQSVNTELQSLLTQLQSLNQSTDTKGIIDILDKMIADCDKLNAIITIDEQSLNDLSQNFPNSPIQYVINTLEAAQQSVAAFENQLKSIRSYVSSNTAKKDISAQISKLSTLANETTNTITTFSNAFYTDGISAFDQMAQVQTTGLDNVDALMEETKAVIPQLDAILNFNISSSKLSVAEADTLKGKLTDLQGILTSLQGKTKDLNEKNLDDLLKLMSMNSKEVSNFLSSPVDVMQVDVYKVGLFGEGLTPFYTVLAIWVGTLLTCALLTVEYKNQENGQKLNLIQKHFGKMLLFLLITAIQATIIVTGDIFLLGVQTANVPLAYLLAIICSVTFTIIIFTLVSLFGNVGKAIAVVIMVFQIAGAGGIYPIQTNPAIFGVLEPLWPFTYAINAFREAIAGPIWQNVINNIRALVLFGIIFLCLVVLKKPFHNLNTQMEVQFKRSGL